MQDTIVFYTLQRPVRNLFVMMYIPNIRNKANGVNLTRRIFRGTALPLAIQTLDEV